VGRIGRPHGLQGEVSVVITSERTERVTPGAVLYAGDRELVVAAAHRHRDRWLFRFEGVDDRTAAESLNGAVLSGAPLDAPAGGELWVHDIVGAEVRDQSGEVLGRIATVQANPAHDLLVLDDGALVPAAFVVDHSPGLVVVDLPPGLLDVNRSDS
jgi:16S rRNA processing protein RimM